ncbi:MAG: stage II sporulation protein E, partial [Ruminococcaceae bacterium]|nr:stage II sporulation protein E [Oscillospiraceae bacterium]
PKNISVIEDKFSRMRVEILTPSSSDSLDNPELRDEIGKICSRYFEKGRITNFKDETMLSFFERPNYKIDIGFAQHSAEGKLCGDTVKIINDYKGNCILIISDGMGKGSRAALDGAMGAGLISRLINAGFGFDSALKVVNCALLVKSNDESLATLDIANIDLFTGKCEMLKAGAPASYIIKNRSTVKCELTSMPAGILRGVEFAKRSAVLKLGDSIALMSDGICDIGESWLEETLIKYSDYSAQKKADLILEEALEKAQSDKTDDMSIIIAKLERN